MKDASWVAAAALTLAAGIIGAGCFETRLARSLKTPDQVKTLDQRSAYLKVHMSDGGVYVLANWRVNDATRAVSGQGERFNPARETMASGSFTISLDEVALLETNVVQRSPSAAALAVVTGISAGVTMACIANPKACFGSCPTFYVSDGKDDVLQAEGFSSSVAPSLEQRDIDALYRIRPMDRDLFVTMKNEALETHVVRHVRLLAAERPRGGRVFQTANGEFRQATGIRPIEACWSGDGDCASRVRAFDGDELFSSAAGDDLTHREIVELRVAAGGPSAGVVIASRQTLASTYLFYQELAWLGRSASDTLAAMERGDRTVGLALARLRAAVGRIEVLAETANGGWTLAGEAGETGPLATDVVAVPLPADATGRVRLRLAQGHWRLDYLASVQLGARVDPVEIEPTSINGSRAKAREATDPLVTLPGDVYAYAFRLPDHPDRHELFLDSQGYYLEWIRDEWLAEENKARAAQLLLAPEQLLREIAPEFKKQEARMEALFWGSRYARR